MTDKYSYTNDLINSESPYLRQHAHNPVNWKNWEEHTWEEAVSKDCLVIVSIGYSTCHWCHVMEHESFEDEEVARLMNEKFISIKVDREERPDIDQIYMDACQIMTGRGGWPLNVICLPDKRPVYAGTYFPKQNWLGLLGELDMVWRNNPNKVYDYANRITKGIRDMNLQEFPARNAFMRSDIFAITDKLSQSFDHEHGGLKRSQKFPLPGIYEYLLDDYLSTGNKESLDFVNFTLIKMANSGIFDHIRGGFYRYATDRQWFAPHFEKMLYDNAQLLSLYSRAFAITKAPLYREVAEKIIGFLETELKSPELGYCSALDADSEGIEGRYYVFTQDELTSAFNDEELQFASLVYNFKPSGNWEHGYNILHKTLSPAELVNASGLSAADFFNKLDLIQTGLRALQEKRIRPSLDYKVICSWNGLLLKGFADASRYLSNQNYILLAENLANDLIRGMNKNGQLIRTYTTRLNAIPAFSEDYACVITGLIALYESNGDAKWIREAADLTESLILNFYDPEKQLFTFTSSREASLIIHKTDLTDDVIPSCNSMMCIALQKLGILSGRNDWYLMGKGMVAAVRSQVLENPEWYCIWAVAAQSEAIGLIQVVFTGDKSEDDVRQFNGMLPSWSVIARETENPSELVAEKLSGKPGIYICLAETCFEPVPAADQAWEIIDDILARA